MKYLLLVIAALFLGACSVDESQTSTTTTVADVVEAPPEPLPLNQTAKNSTVQVVIKKGARGSGVYIGQELVLTAGHVCDAIKKKTVTVVSVVNKEVINVIGYIIDKRYPQVDLCVMKLETKPVDLTPIKFALTEAQLGEMVYLSSFSGGHGYSLRGGYVLAEESVTIEGPIFLVTVTNIFAEPGCSGGPVLNQNKELTGIMIIQNRASGTGGFEPLRDVQSFLQQQLGLFF